MGFRGCNICNLVTAIVFIVLGIIFILGDLGIFRFWGINWYSALFIVLGITGCIKASCGNCQQPTK